MIIYHRQSNFTTNFLNSFIFFLTMRLTSISPIFIFLACSLLVNAQELQPCNLDQLAGDEELFSVTGGGSEFTENSEQAILWDRPSGAPVRRILENVTILDTGNGLFYPLTNVSNVPVIFANEEQEIHQTGAIGLTLPAVMPESDDYVFRVTIRSRGTVCYLDTDLFSISSNIENPSDACFAGDMRCTDDLSGFRQCFETTQDATEFAFNDVIACAATTLCQQITNSTIACVSTDSVDECTLGAAECVTENSSRVCVPNENGNTVWSLPTECVEGFSCSAETNLCEEDVSIPPTDECTLGAAECVTENSSRVCVPNEDGNTVWSTPTECVGGFSCSAETKLCEPDEETDECIIGTFECVDENSNRVCVDDENGRGIWSDPADCSTGQLCNLENNQCEFIDECVEGTSECVSLTETRQCILNENTGATEWTDAGTCQVGTCSSETGLCTSTTPPGSSCIPRSQICLSDTEFDECVQGEDGFWNFGGVTMNCPENTVCNAYLNNTINCEPFNIDTVGTRKLFRFKRV